MTLATGTVSIHSTTGDVSGSGYARGLYDIEAAAELGLSGDLDDYVDTTCDGFATASTDPPTWEAGGSGRVAFRAQKLSRRQAVATKCNAQAAAVVALVQTATVTVPVASTPTTAIGTLT